MQAAADDFTCKIHAKAASAIRELPAPASRQCVRKRQ